METHDRRSVLQWLAAAVAAVFCRSTQALVPGGTLSMGLAAQAPVLRTEDFESGAVAMASVGSAALAAMLRDLHARREYDAACHGGLPGPDSEYLTQWINHVSGELVCRGEDVSAIGVA